MRLHIEDKIGRALLARQRLPLSNSSISPMSKNFPKTEFMASNAAAIPPVVLRKSRRVKPRRTAVRSTSAVATLFNTSLRLPSGRREQILRSTRSASEWRIEMWSLS